MMTCNRQGFAGDRGFVDRRAWIQQVTVYRYKFAGPNQQFVSGCDVFNGNIGQILADPFVCRPGCPVPQRSQVSLGLSTSVILEHIAARYT